ncbi:hypothetical protein E8E13_007553 [Curvularia kusanoi]|uniref:Uncharacterized protein n=1 Tax=Curvularia kusanoi TaxID=90978 RepID=A0A9P4T919_CURKU|nr:hypothetical protein E8E13_007553 [Curvularia kusanoi]
MTPNSSTARARRCVGSPKAQVKASLVSVAPNFTRIKEHDPEVEKKPLRQQQTFKIRHKLGLWDWIKGVFNREGLMQDIHDSIEVVHTDDPDYTMFDHEKSPYYRTVQISPRTNSTQYMTARCLFDTGCYQGNIVSRRLVEQLGYSDEDFEPVSPREAAGGQTVTGEPVAVEAVVRLSWHHNTSPHTYQRMRFLVSSSTQCDMIVGVHSIVKHRLLNELTYATGTKHVPDNKKTVVELNDKKERLQSNVEDLEILCDDAASEKEKNEYSKQLAEAKHHLKVAELRAEAANIEDASNRETPKKPTPAQKKAAEQAAIVVAQKRREADEQERDWAKKHAPRVSAAAASGSAVRQPGPRVVSSSTKKGPPPSGSSQKKA